jgi:hypothetical protein
MDHKDNSAPMRIIVNQKELAAALQEKYGAKFELF